MLTNFGCYAFVSCVIHIVWSQGPVQLTFSSNPVYSGKEVTMTFSYAPGVQLLRLTVGAFNGTLKQGFLFTDVASNVSTGEGVLANKSLNGWPNIIATATSFSMTFTVTPSHDLDYNCSVLVFNSTALSVQTLTCSPARILVYSCPSTPIFKPSPIAFSDSDNGVVICESRNGKPPALVSLLVSDARGARHVPANGNDSALVVLPSPLSDWHNATATCRITNHNCTTTSEITGFVQIRFNTSVPDEVCTNASNVTLNCSAHVRSYPGFLYKWTVPAEANVTANLELESLTVPQGQVGSFNCTVTNNITLASTVIVFIVSNVCRPSSTPIDGLPSSAPSGLYWIIGLVLGIIAVVIAIVIGVLCKRGHFSKGKNTPGVVPSGTDQRMDNGTNRGSLLYVYDGPTSWIKSTELDSDADPFRLVDQHTLASSEVASRKGLALSTSNAPAQDRHYAEDIRKPSRLLIVAEGAVAQLSQRTLRTTTVIEYSDRSSSLNDILEKLEQAVPRSSPKFKSVALLLRPAKVGVTLSEVDQAVLNSSSIQEEKGEKLRAFITHMAKICLDERGGTRIDILNYNGKAPVRLSEGLTKLIGIPTTVSRDQFGVDTPAGEAGGNAVVADAYFDRNNLGEVVYAELQQPSVKPQAQPRQPDDRVIYSEIKR